MFRSQGAPQPLGFESFRVTEGVAFPAPPPFSYAAVTAGAKRGRRIGPAAVAVSPKGLRPNDPLLSSGVRKANPEERHPV
jgi:hypothetical protein